MSPVRNRWCVGVLLAVTALSASAARADLWKDARRGFQLFDWRFQQAPNPLGQGWDLGGAVFYNNRTFRFGLADLTLTGSANLSTGFTTRGIPEARFSFNTNGPMNYAWDVNTGFQDFQANGSLLMTIDGRINALGFYDQIIQISNRGTFATDGFGLVDSGTTDYDLGPINISGNIVFDALAALSEPFFAGTNLENPFAKFSARATKVAGFQETVDAYRARIESGELLTNAQMAELLNGSFALSALTGRPAEDFFADLVLPDELSGADVSEAPEFTVGPAQADPREALVPEPASIFLFLLGCMALQRRRS